MFMKKLKIPMLASLLMLVLAACSADQSYSGENNFKAEESEASPAADDGIYGNAMSQTAKMDNSIVTESLMSSSAAQMNPLMDSSHQFIRRAEARFRVKDVRTATFRIEKLTAQYGGYVENTNLESVNEGETHTKVSDDSTLVTNYFTVRNDLVLRIPAENLDSTLRSFVPLVEYFDYRRISVEDVTLKLLRENLVARRVGNTTKRLEHAVETGESKLRDRAAVEESLYNKQTMADEAFLKRLEIQDQIKFSTVSVHIYQRQTWTQEMIANEKPVKAYEPGFFTRIGKSLKNGWEGFLELLILLANAWPLLVVILIIVGFVRFVVMRKKG